MSENLRVINVEGGHVTFVDEVNARPTAARLAEILAEARARFVESSRTPESEAAVPAGTGIETAKLRAALHRTPLTPESTSNVS
jgi:hypothetical protein